MEEIQELEYPLTTVEARLRKITPSKLYADAWISPSTRNMTRVFNHLRTLHRILHGYLPRQVIESPRARIFRGSPASSKATVLLRPTENCSGTLRSGRLFSRRISSISME